MTLARPGGRAHSAPASRRLECPCGPVYSVPMIVTTLRMALGRWAPQAGLAWWLSLVGKRGGGSILGGVGHQESQRQGELQGQRLFCSLDLGAQTPRHFQGVRPPGPSACQMLEDPDPDCEEVALLGCWEGWGVHTCTPGMHPGTRRATLRPGRRELHAHGPGHGGSDEWPRAWGQGSWWVRARFSTAQARHRWRRSCPWWAHRCPRGSIGPRCPGVSWS